MQPQRPRAKLNLGKDLRQREADLQSGQFQLGVQTQSFARQMLFGSRTTH